MNNFALVAMMLAFGAAAWLMPLQGRQASAQAAEAGAAEQGKAEKGATEKSAEEKDGADDKAVPAAIAFTVKTNTGDDVALHEKYAGKVVLIVNVASKCGHTKQYADLQTLDEKYAQRGLAILAFPCNQFGKQEPGSNEEILEFCTTKFGVKFDLFDKVDVNGDNAAPLFAHLTSDKTGLSDTGDVKWNFEKFLVDRQGKVIARFRSKVNPMSPAMVQAIEAALGPAEAEKDQPDKNQDEQ